MSKQFVGRVQHSDGYGGWTQSHGYQLFSTDKRPVVDSRAFGSYAEAEKAAGSTRAGHTSLPKPNHLWSPTPTPHEETAREEYERRRASSVLRYVNYAAKQADRYLVRRVVRCDAQGGLPNDYQPACPILVLQVGEPTAIATLSDEEWATALAKVLNERENDLQSDEQLDERAGDRPSNGKSSRWKR